MSTQIFVETVHKEPELVRTISVTSLSLTTLAAQRQEAPNGALER